MTEMDLSSLVEGLERQRQPAPEPIQERSASGTALVVSCMMADCRHGPSLWPIDPSGDARAVQTLGAQTWTAHDGQRELDETLTHLTATHDVHAVVVVGHTDCTVLGDAYEHAVVSTGAQSTAETHPESVVSLVEEAVSAGVVDQSLSDRQARARLVEYSVGRQVAFLTDSLPETVTVAGYVHDQTGVYGPFPDKLYLVSIDGVTDTDTLAGRLPDHEPVPVASLLD